MATRRTGGWQPPDNSSGGTGPMVQRIRAEIEELAEVIGAVSPRLTDLDNRLREIGMAMRDLEIRVAEQDTGAREIAALLKRLDARVEWLERNIRLQAATAEAVLEDVGPEEIRLAGLAEAGLSAAAGLLSGSARSGMESAIQAHAGAVEAHNRHRAQALAACRTLASTPWTDQAHHEAASQFEREFRDAEQVRQSIRQLAGPALMASQKLADDEERHAAVADVVSRGDQAASALAAMLRARLAEAVGTGSLLPSWFTSVLGPIPPAQDTRRWMDAGTALLAYRITYAISDPVQALGPRPDRSARPRQASWHDQLTRQLNELRT